MLEKTVEGPRAGLAARLAAALRSSDGAELAAISADFQAMGDLIAATDSAAHAALAFRAHGMRGSAFTYANRAEVLATQCGGAKTPALRDAAEPLPLSPREREIVTLLAAGLTNREIGDRLVLSVRTIEGHIYHAMARTGMASREELAALMERQR